MGASQSDALHSDEEEPQSMHLGQGRQDLVERRGDQWSASTSSQLLTSPDAGWRLLRPPRNRDTNLRLSFSGQNVGTPSSPHPTLSSSDNMMNTRSREQNVGNDKPAQQPKANFGNLSAGEGSSDDSEESEEETGEEIEAQTDHHDSVFASDANNLIMDVEKEQLPLVEEIDGDHLDTKVQAEPSLPKRKTPSSNVKVSEKKKRRKVEMQFDNASSAAQSQQIDRSANHAENTGDVRMDIESKVVEETSSSSGPSSTSDREAPSSSVSSSSVSSPAPSLQKPRVQVEENAEKIVDLPLPPSGSSQSKSHPEKSPILGSKDAPILIESAPTASNGKSTKTSQISVEDNGKKNSSSSDEEDLDNIPSQPRSDLFEPIPPFHKGSLDIKYIIVVLLNESNWQLCEQLSHNFKFQLHVFGTNREVAKCVGNVTFHPKGETMRWYLNLCFPVIVEQMQDLAIVTSREEFDDMRKEWKPYISSSMRVHHLQHKQDVANLKASMPMIASMIRHAVQIFKGEELNRIMRQIEFYFSNDNYPFDKFMKEKIAEFSYLPFNDLQRFPIIAKLLDRNSIRMRNHNISPCILLAAAVFESREMKISKNLKGVERGNPVRGNLHQMDYLRKQRRVYLYGLEKPLWKQNDEYNIISNIKFVFGTWFGEISRVKICWNPYTGMPTGYFFLEFTHMEDKELFLPRLQYGFMYMDSLVRAITREQFYAHQFI